MCNAPKRGAALADEYQLSTEDAFKQAQSTPAGLSNEEAQARKLTFGPNSLKEEVRQSALVTFLEQFKSVPVFLLALASIVSAVLGEYIEAGAIAAILLINAVIGFIQEQKAGDAIAALKKLTALKVKVLRNGTKQLINAEELVPGDVIFLETGDKVPADARVIEAHNACALESALTGESVPVSKSSETLSGKKALGDQQNMVFSGTVMTSGRLSAVVMATGMKSEIGKIATMLSQVEEPPSPLQQKVDAMVHKLSVVVLGMSVVVFVTLWLTKHDEHIFDSLITAVALAVAALPEGLPIILTITAAIGIKRMVKRNVLIRRLMSVETLGSVTVICTDKTGTLTKNQMTVQKVYVNGSVLSITGEGYDAQGKVEGHTSTELTYLLTCGVLCNNASWFSEKVTGDPTEIALIVSAAKGGLGKDRLDHQYPRQSENEFTSERKIMSTTHSFGKTSVLFAKGAPDIMLTRCTHILEGGKLRKLTHDDRERILSQIKAFSAEALRVLGFAYKEGTDGKEENLAFLGLQAMMDPPREEVRESIARCRDAGIKVVMITGDHPDTAAAVAKRLDLEVKVLTGEELDSLSDLDQFVEDIIIYARVNPEHKLKIVAALQHKGHIVAMTGDGVNDAPALRKADMGVAMGITGTDVAKEASKMIITDDNFSSIVNAVEEGRNIYDNIRRFIRYQISTNVGAILIILTSILVRVPLPLLPLQLLWINLSIDGPPALSLGLEPSSNAVMKRKPRPKSEPLLTKAYLFHIFFGGIIMAAGTFAVFLAYNSMGDYVKATTMAFVTFTFFQFFNVLNCRSLHQSIFAIGVFRNRMAWMTIVCMGIITAILVNWSFTQTVFHLTDLAAKEWLLCAAVASSVLIIYEIKKLFLGRFLQHN